MIDVKEHFYDDDPLQGHPDVRTRLKDVSYFFLGNGLIQAAVQVAPSGEGTAAGLLIMNPEHFGKKREALTMDSSRGLERTLVRIVSGTKPSTVNTETMEADWFDEYRIPAVRIQWQAPGLQIKEQFYCPDLSQALLMREVRIKNLKERGTQVRVQTGALQESLEREIFASPGKEEKVFFSYKLDHSGEKIVIDSIPEAEITQESVHHWNKAHSSFGSALLEHYFNASRFQLAAAVSKSGKVDGGIWQYNREWVRDQAMIARGLTVSGNFEMARKMLKRLLEEFVTEQGDTIDSSEKRDRDEVELDQNGVLLDSLKHYVLWSGDLDLVQETWEKIFVTAEFPLSSVFCHQPSGLLANRREYWERHRVHGIQKGMELSHQLFTSIGLSSAAALARMTSRQQEAIRWEAEALRIRKAMLEDTRFGLVAGQGFIKRRKVDGSVEEAIDPLPEARLPAEVPLSSPGVHLLNPDSSAALAIATGFIPPGSSLALETLANLEGLWNQAWEGGGYGRYHFSSEPDSPGSWPFPSLFIARAWLEAGDMEKVWRVLRWLNSLPGAKAGTWFEFYGKRLAPPFPQVGITPWTWAEMIILLVHHLIGIRPEAKELRIRPKLLPGIERIHCSFPLRGGRVKLEVKKAPDAELAAFRSNGRVKQASKREALISYSEKELWVEASVP
jgi:hypothetical protein